MKLIKSFLAAVSNGMIREKGCRNMNVEAVIWQLFFEPLSTRKLSIIEEDKQFDWIKANAGIWEIFKKEIRK